MSTNSYQWFLKRKYYLHIYFLYKKKGLRFIVQTKAVTISFIASFYYINVISASGCLIILQQYSTKIPHWSIDIFVWIPFSRLKSIWREQNLFLWVLCLWKLLLNLEIRTILKRVINKHLKINYLNQTSRKGGFPFVLSQQEQGTRKITRKSASTILAWTEKIL